MTKTSGSFGARAMNSGQLREQILSFGASEVGFFHVPQDYRDDLLTREGGAGLGFGISIVVALSKTVLGAITDKPTFAYFHHYRTVNALIDQIVLRTGLLIAQAGFSYLPVAASQSTQGYRGLFSHKAGARLAGLGGIGKNGLFLSDTYGAAVRLGTILTDQPLPQGKKAYNTRCSGCNICRAVCPAMAISGMEFDEGNANNRIVDAAACSAYMKKHFQHIGRGVVCGICIKNCPASRIEST